MKRLILLLLIFAGASATIPQLREQVEPRVLPVWDYGLRQIEPAMRRALEPAYRWSAENEARGIARSLRQRALGLQPLPSPRELQSFIEKHRLAGQDGLDPWGSQYYLIARRDSIIVGSPGPDRQRGTEDDIQVSVGRR